MKHPISTMILLTLVSLFLPLGVVMGQERIVGGVEATRGEFPFIVQINVRGQHTCTGVILNSEWVLTTGSCANSAPSDGFSIVAGEHNRDAIEGSEQVRAVRDRFVAQDDIGLIRLTSIRPLVFDQYVQPARLPQVNSTAPENATVAGWGMTSAGGQLSSILMKVDVPRSVDIESCNASSVGDNRLCYSTVGKTFCSGDVGAPLVSSDGTLIGLASRVEDGCTGEGPGVFVDVSKHLEWIRYHTIPKAEDPTPVQEIKSCSGNIDATSGRINLTNIPPGFTCIWTVNNPHDYFRIGVNQSTLAEEDVLTLSRVWVGIYGSHQYYTHRSIKTVGDNYTEDGAGGVWLILLGVANTNTSTPRSLTLDYFQSGYRDRENNPATLITLTEESGEFSYPIGGGNYENNEMVLIVLSSSSAGRSKSVRFTHMDVEDDPDFVCNDVVAVENIESGGYSTRFWGCGHSPPTESFALGEGVGFVLLTTDPWSVYSGFTFTWG